MKKTASIFSAFGLLLWAWLGISLVAFAQDDKVKFSAASLKGETINGIKFNVFRSGSGKRVILTQGTTKVYCNEARENTVTKNVTATGNVIIKDQGKDKTTITGDYLFLNKAKGEVRIEGRKRKVKLQDKEMTLLTDVLYYDMKSKNARYVTGGIVTRESMVLTSLKGYLNNTTKVVAFKTNVVMDDTVKNQHLETDTLTYYTEKKVGYFHTRTKMTTKDGDAEADRGQFNTDNNQIQLFGNAMINTNQGYTMNSEEIISLEENDLTIAKNNVKLYSIKDQVTIFSDEVKYRRSKATTFAYGRALMQKPLSNADTLFLAADTLVSVTDTLKDATTLFAYYKVKIFSGQIRSKCDSLTYVYQDSIINFYDDPVLWSDGNQMTGQTIKAKLSGNTLDKLYLDTDGFILSQDSLKNWNQVKGNNIVATFRAGKELDKVDVNGNGQTIYFAMNDAKDDIIGMNLIKCGNMIMYFAEKNELSNMDFLSNPESSLIPPHELEEPDTRLPGFRLRFEEAPTRDFVEELRADRRTSAPPIVPQPQKSLRKGIRLEGNLKREEASPKN